MRWTGDPRGVILLGVADKGPLGPPGRAGLCGSSGRMGGEAAPTNTSVASPQVLLWIETRWCKRDVHLEISHTQESAPGLEAGWENGTLCSANSSGVLKILPRTTDNLGSASVYLMYDLCPASFQSALGHHLHNLFRQMADGNTESAICKLRVKG